MEHLRILFDEMFNGELSFDGFLHDDITHRITQKIDGKRTVYVADPTLRYYHRFLQRHFVRPLRLNLDVVYSYRKDTNISDAVRKHAHNKYFFQTDLSNFFPSITSELIRSTLVQSEKEMRFLNASEYFDRAVALLTVDNRLPPGFSTSPAISNACLYRLDDCFQDYCKKQNLIFTRYSDDIIISGIDKDCVNAAAIQLPKIIKEHYDDTFAFNLGKSKFIKTGRKIKLLGMAILPNGVVTIDSALKRKIEVLLHYYITDSFAFLRLVHDDLEKGTKSLAGYISFVHAVDTAYFSKLCSKYSSSAIESLLRMRK